MKVNTLILQSAANTDLVKTMAGRQLGLIVLAALACTRAFVAPAARRAPSRLRGEPVQQEVLDDDPLVVRLAEEVGAINGGAGLDALLNPAKLINTERALVELRARRDAGDGSAALEKEIASKEAVVYVEKRAVMRDWLKTLFRGQAYVTIGISLLMVYDAVPFFSPLDLSVRVLGFWSWWLFTVPSLRSIKPLAAPEKKALDAAFLATLVGSLLAPFATKDPATIWWIDFGIVAACYGYGYVAPESAPDDDDDDLFDAKAAGGAGAFGQQLWRSAKWAGRALDVGGGRERGARSADASAVEKALESAVASKAAAASKRAAVATLEPEEADDYDGIPP